MKNFTIRNEQPSDYKEVENLVRESFGMYIVLGVWSIMCCIASATMRLSSRNLIS